MIYSVYAYIDYPNSAPATAPKGMLLIFRISRRVRAVPIGLILILYKFSSPVFASFNQGGE